MIDYIQKLYEYVVALAHVLAMVVILIGFTKAGLIYFRDIFTRHRSKQAIQESRLEIGHSFSLALAFLIGASILNTTLAPSWNEIGQLAAIIAIRTALNYVLIRDLSEPESVV